MPKGPKGERQRARSPEIACRSDGAQIVALDLPVRLSATMSKLIFWPSLRSCIPARVTALMWTKTSPPPPSGSMKPKPFWVLNHFTFPVVIFASFRASARVCTAGRAITISMSRRECRAPARNASASPAKPIGQNSIDVHFRDRLQSQTVTSCVPLAGFGGQHLHQTTSTTAQAYPQLRATHRPPTKLCAFASLGSARAPAPSAYRL